MSRELVELVADVLAGAEEPAAGALPGCWPTIVELGLAGVGIPAEHGGSDGTPADLVVLCREIARRGVGAPLGEAAVANWVLSGQVAPSPGLPAVVLGGPDPSGDGLVSGTLPPLAWGRHCARLVLLSRTGAFVLDTGLPEAGAGVAVREAGTNLAGEPCDVLELSAVPVTRLAAGGPSADAVRVRLGLLRGAALTGALRGAYELTRGYVTTREQFGRPLVRIPAVAAHLARMRTWLQQAEVALERATVTCADGGGADRDETAPPAAVAVLRVVSGQAATHVARIAHQLHGAMGVTQEYPLHRFTRRLWAWRDAGTPEHALAGELGDLALAGGERGLWERLTAPVDPAAAAQLP